MGGGEGVGGAYVEFIKHEARFSSLRILRRFLKLHILDFFFFICRLFNTAPSAAAQIPLQSEDAGIGPSTVATLALTTNYSAKSHLKLFLISLVSSNELFVRLKDNDYIALSLAMHDKSYNKYISLELYKYHYLTAINMILLEIS